MVMTVSRQANVVDSVPSWNLLMAMAMLALLPPVLVVVFMQRQFVRGLVEKKRRNRSMAQVHLRGVKKTYDDKLEVIHGVDIDIADGEFVVIVGPSGCGKSTLLRMVAGLERITGGEIAIGDRVVNELEPKERDIAMVFQNYALYPHIERGPTTWPTASRSAAGPKAEIDRRVRKAAKILELGTAPAAPAAPALGRPAPARRHGPRHRARARGVPVRRAALQPRRQAARADARSRSSACNGSSPSPRSTSPMTRSRR